MTTVISSTLKFWTTHLLCQNVYVKENPNTSQVLQKLQFRRTGDIWADLVLDVSDRGIHAPNTKVAQQLASLLLEIDRAALYRNICQSNRWLSRFLSIVLTPLARLLVAPGCFFYFLVDFFFCFIPFLIYRSVKAREPNEGNIAAFLFFYIK